MSDEPLPEWAAPERNKEPILEVLARVLPRSGKVLEVASATGQHAEHFARNMPGLVWQPSDVDPEHLAVLRERVRRAGLENLLPPILLDATAENWPVEAVDAIYNANMIHIAPWEVALGLLRGAGALLRSGGKLVTYGPYKRDGQHTSESNARFDASLKERDARWGVRDLAELARVAQTHGLIPSEPVTMPANNHCVIWEKH